MSPATTQVDRDNLARWYADRHHKIDSGVVKIFHLPAGAEANEIRLLEINKLIPETTALEPFDFGVDIDSVNGHTLYVLDVTPAQWQAIQEGELLLPEGWTLDGKQELTALPKKAGTGKKGARAKKGTAK